MTSQQELRRQVLARRDRLPVALIREMSLAVMGNLFDLGLIQKQTAVMFYASFRSEVRTWEGMAHCLAVGARLALPLAVPGCLGLQPRVVSDPAGELRPGFCAIPEPDPERTGFLSPAELAVVIVPGSVFDRWGGRLGYGGGYYDRFLANEAPQALRVGLAFALQVVDQELPLAVHDQRLDYLVTEEGACRCSRDGRVAWR